MAKKPPASDLVDWTLSQAPDPGEPASDSGNGQAALEGPAAHLLERPAGARGFSSKAVVRTSLILAAVAGLAFVAIKISAAWDAYRLRRGVGDTVALEERSAPVVRSVVALGAGDRGVVVAL